ncbi:MAG: hypothetical protein MZU97_12090 [Bacillus subtilis]|nr:hypothetical protein [Bacillus subtilis]
MPEAERLPPEEPHGIVIIRSRRGRARRRRRQPYGPIVARAASTASIAEALEKVESDPGRMACRERTGAAEEGQSRLPRPSSTAIRSQVRPSATPARRPLILADLLSSRNEDWAAAEKASCLAGRRSRQGSHLGADCALQDAAVGRRGARRHRDGASSYLDPGRSRATEGLRGIAQRMFALGRLDEEHEAVRRGHRPSTSKLVAACADNDWTKLGPGPYNPPEVPRDFSRKARSQPVDFDGPGSCRAVFVYKEAVAWRRSVPKILEAKCFGFDHRLHGRRRHLSAPATRPTGSCHRN